MSYRDKLSGLNKDLLSRIDQTQSEIDWLRNASGCDLLDMATDSLNYRPIKGVAEDYSAVEFGNLSRGELGELLSPFFVPGTQSVEDLCDQVYLCRAFANPRLVTEKISTKVDETVEAFPAKAGDILTGKNPGDVLDPFILAANIELISSGSLPKAIEHTIGHKILMKIEDMLGHLHESTFGEMRGNFRIPEPGGKKEDKETLNRITNPFPGADVGQVPTIDKPEAIRLFQVKSKTGSAKGGDGTRLGQQLSTLQQEYGAETYYVSVVGNTLSGHRSRGAVVKASPQTVVLVGEAAHNELTQSEAGGELLLRAYQRAFRRAAERSGYSFAGVTKSIVATFDNEARRHGEDFITVWLHEAIDGEVSAQDSRMYRPRSVRG
ncbi:hypothetical protein ACTXOW_01395 [Corynebacterium variabile]|uniref:hypothetical protein n=1 Tax=Corynebacterium variabile TaxID=1727 RepID=UPI0011D2B075|nr:hypothetical protein [Corynebacterium variabile]